jgi:putative phage-type endonuclease
MDEKEWLDWRAKGIGSSDAPIIWGSSPYSTLYKLWERKTGRITEGESNWAMRRGTAMEPQARAHYELENNCDMPATLVQHPSLPYMRASLDGYNRETKVVLEIKCPGRADHEMALNGQVPAKYYPQLQHQLFVSNADRVDYFSFFDGRGVTVQVNPDIDFIQQYVAKAMDFWLRNVIGDSAPDLCMADYKGLRNRELRLALVDWKNSGEDPKLMADIFQHFKIESQRIRIAGFLIDGPASRIYFQP